MPGQQVGKETLGARVRRLRKEKGYKGTAFAEKAGIHRNTLSKVETDKRAEPDTIAAIADALDLDVATLTAGVQNHTDGDDQRPDSIRAKVTHAVDLLTSALADLEPTPRPRPGAETEPNAVDTGTEVADAHPHGSEDRRSAGEG